MAILEIKTPVDVPLWTQRVTLDGRDFVLRFDYNERQKRYYLDIGLTNGTWLARGIKVVPNWPLTRRFADRRFFPGELQASTINTNDKSPPEYGELGIGQRVTLMYYDAEETGALDEGTRAQIFGISIDEGGIIGGGLG